MLNILGAAPGLVEAPYAALQVIAAATAVGFALIIVLVVLQPHGVPLQQLSPTFSGTLVLGLVRWSPILPAATLIRTGAKGRFRTIAWSSGRGCAWERPTGPGNANVEP